MDELTTLIIARSLERFAAIILGGIAVYMSFRLFMVLPNITDPDSFRFKKYVSLHLLKITLGVLFLVFGGFIVLSSIHKAPQFEERVEKNARNEMPVTTRAFSGMRAQSSLETAHAIQDSVVSIVQQLNLLENQLEPGMNERQAHFLHLYISRLKLSMMTAIWHEDQWGRASDFREWVIAGEDPANEPNLTAKHIFLSSTHP